MKPLPPRDSRGRFTRAKPKAPLDPALVKSLGAHRRPFEWVAEQPWEIVILERKRYTVDEGSYTEACHDTAND